MSSKEELLAKAQKPARDAMILHPFYRGKIELAPRCCIRNFDDFAIWYTPGVAEPCRAIQREKNLVYEYTNKWNSVAVVSDGTRVLGLGDIGPEAALPVMEGKALLFKYLGGVDAFPICLAAPDADDLIHVTKALEPSFGGINLEDISQPKCFRVLKTLREEMQIPVWHDDQQGTAAVTLAGLVNALKVVGKKLCDVRIAMIGAGAANICIARILMAAGADPEKIIMVDIGGILHRGRSELREYHREQWEMCLVTNGGNVTGGIPEAMKGAEALISLAAPGPDIIKPEWIRTMAKDPIVFACANPIPEIWPWEAKEAGAAVVATGRSDFPNQVNNSLGFPGIFRGTLDVRARAISDEMCIAAAMELARCAEDGGLSEERIVPAMNEWEVYPREAAAVAVKAVEQGLAAIPLTWEEAYVKASAIIRRAREEAAALMKGGFIPSPP